MIPAILSQAPIDLMIIMLGTNGLKVSFTPSEDVLSRAMEELLKIIKNPYIWEHRKLPEIPIVFLPTICDQIGKSHFCGMYDQKSVELSKKMGYIYERVSKSYACHFIDAALHVKASEQDCIHMNPENHRKLAQVLSKEIKKY